MRPARSFLALAAALLLAAPALAGLGPAPQQAHVHIQDFAFNPATVTILVGESVTWDNHDAVAHTATANDTSFDSGRLGPGQSFAHVFGSAGTFGYVCAIHSTSMFGTVIVSDPTAQPDLAVTSFVVEDDGLLAKTLNVTVRNLGLNLAGPTTLRLAYHYQGERPLIDDVELGQLGPGESRVVRVTWDTLGKVGEFTVEATADATEAVAEGNEGNNAATATATVLVGGVEGIDLLDPL